MLNKIASELAALAEQHIGQPLQAVANDRRQTLVRLTFGIFVGGLIALLILLYSGVAIV
jgi:type VI protein secretion system component VasF